MEYITMAFSHDLRYTSGHLLPCVEGFYVSHVYEGSLKMKDPNGGARGASGPPFDQRIGKCRISTNVE